MSARASLPAVAGLRRMLHNLPLALLLWGTQLLIAATVALPLRAGLSRALGDRPAAAELLATPSAGFLADLVRNADGAFAIGPRIGLAVVLALLANALLAGGALETLLAADGRPLGHRFGRGAGRFAGRMLRVGAAASVVAVGIALLAALPFAAAARVLWRSGSDAAATWLAGGGAVVAGLLLVGALLALDLARVRIVRDDRRDTLRALAGGLGALLWHPLRLFGAWLPMALLAVALVALYVLVAGAAKASTMVAILALAAMQQAVSFARAALRVALWSAEIEIDERIAPRSLAPAIATGGPEQGLAGREPGEPAPWRGARATEEA